MSAKTTRQTAAQRAAAKKAGQAAVADAAARALAPETDEAPADTQTDLAKSSKANADKAAAAVQKALAEVPVEDHPTTLVEHVYKGQTVKVAEGTKRQKDAAARAILAAAEERATPVEEAPAPASTPKPSTPRGEKKEWTILDSYNTILAKAIPPKSQRERVVADLSTGQHNEDLQAIVRNLQDLVGVDLARGLNALNATLSAHYGRVSK
jgi:hypothetical protein